MAPAADADAPIRVLLVEDDEDDVVLIRGLLSAIGHPRYDLDWEPDPERAIEAICEERHDVYLVDHHLGRLTGVDVLREVHRRGCDGPLILLTGQASLKTDLAGMAAGALDFLAKDGLTPMQLERSIRYGIAQRAASDLLSEARLQVADAAEAERLRLARELHDGPLQDLIAVHLQLGRAGGEGNAPSAAIADAEATLVATIGRLRDICRELRPPSLGPFGLEGAIRSHARRFQELHPEMALELRVDPDGEALGEDTRMAMFRIYQQALANIVRHAGASNVVVSLQIDPRIVRLEVADDGQGFVVPAGWEGFARRGRYGLMGAAERAESIGGRLDVVSAPNDGTRVRVVAPLAPEAAAPALEAADG